MMLGRPHATASGRTPGGPEMTAGDGTSRAVFLREIRDRPHVDQEIMRTAGGTGQHRLVDGAVVVERLIAPAILEEEDRRELRADFQHLRRWRKSVEQAQSYTFKAMITVIVTGFVGAVWLGVKVMLGK